MIDKEKVDSHFWILNNSDAFSDGCANFQQVFEHSIALPGLIFYHILEVKKVLKTFEETDS